MKSAYQGHCFLLTTKHAKAQAVGPAFEKHLGAAVLEYVVDTDQLGTFSGEIERAHTPLKCARLKCETPFRRLGDKVSLALANEGSFGPHPTFPFLTVDREILYFIDRDRDFQLHLVRISEKTNFAVAEVNTWEEIQSFAQRSLFPSHGLILRLAGAKLKPPLYKGIHREADLQAAYLELRKHWGDKPLHIETDMRAQHNPSRMSVIANLAQEFAQRLTRECPQCRTPGWGRVRQELGLPCGWCGKATNLVKQDIFGCSKCTHEEARPVAESYSDPGQCMACNP